MLVELSYDIPVMFYIAGCPEEIKRAKPIKDIRKIL